MEEDYNYHYDILGCKCYEPFERVKEQYRKLCLEHHPDKGGDVSMFELITNSYNIVSKLKNFERYPDGNINYKDDEDVFPSCKTGWKSDNNDLFDELPPGYEDFSKDMLVNNYDVSNPNDLDNLIYDPNEFDASMSKVLEKADVSLDDKNNLDLIESYVDIETVTDTGLHGFDLESVYVNPSTMVNEFVCKDTNVEFGRMVEERSLLVESLVPPIVERKYKNNNGCE